MKQTRATQRGFGILMQRRKGETGILVQRAVCINSAPIVLGRYIPALCYFSFMTDALFAILLFIKHCDYLLVVLSFEPIRDIYLKECFP